jgi:hypothetical protein
MNPLICNCRVRTQAYVYVQDYFGSWRLLIGTGSFGLPAYGHDRFPTVASAIYNSEVK